MFDRALARIGGFKRLPCSPPECMRRRDFLKATSGAAGGAAAVGSAVGSGAVGTAAAQEQPDFGGWLSESDGGFTDARGQSEVTVQVGAEGNGGAFAFSPAGLWVDTGTTVVWEWTGAGGQHNVVARDGAFESEYYQAAGTTFEHTFAATGVFPYYCEPHREFGMKGGVRVE